MKGVGIICLKVDQHSYHEHATVRSAKAEAARLALALNAEIVVYAPVYRALPPRPATAERCVLPLDAKEELGLVIQTRDEDDDLPF